MRILAAGQVKVYFSPNLHQFLTKFENNLSGQCLASQEKLFMQWQLIEMFRMEHMHR